MSQLSALAHRGRTIGEDLADSVGSAIGFARARHDDAQAGGTARQAGLVVSAALDGFLLATFRQLRAPSTEQFFEAPLAEVAALVAHLERHDVLAVPETYQRAPHGTVIEADVAERRHGWIAAVA